MAPVVRIERTILFMSVMGLVACASSSGSPTINSTMPDAAGTDGGSMTSDGGDQGLVVESTLSLELRLATAPADGGAPAGPDGSGSASPTTLEITARDGTAPVVTDLWLYTLDGDQMTPLTAFASTAARKTPRLMLPATIGDQPSGLVPADDGRQNGLMTNATRGRWVQGAFVSTVDGTVMVTLPAPPTSPILVIAGIEDERYAGAAAINPDNTTASVPAGVGAPESHVRRSFERDVKPILAARCGVCHNDQGPLGASLYLVTGSREDLVNDNFALKEQGADCAKATPDDSLAQASCIQAVTKAQFLVEPGAPALTDLLQRARPDESAGTSALGLVWYGSRGNRYNATYGDRRMPQTTESTSMTDWTNAATYFDDNPTDFQILFDWVAQGAQP